MPIIRPVRLIDQLRDLQTTDSALDQRRERLARVRELLADRSAVEQAQAERDAAEVARRRAEGEQLDLELEVANLRAKIAANQKKLYSGKGSPKELQSLQAEIEQDERLVSDREDRLLAAYDATAAATAARDAAQQRLEEVTRRWQAEHDALEQEAAALTTELARLTAERQARAAALDPQALRTYEHLRRTKGGLAVAAIRQRACQGCRVTLPANVELRARAGRELVTCQNCGRILYVA